MLGLRYRLGIKKTIFTAKSQELQSEVLWYLCVFHGHLVDGESICRAITCR